MYSQWINTHYLNCKLRFFFFFKQYYQGGEEPTPCKAVVQLHRSRYTVSMTPRSLRRALTEKTTKLDSLSAGRIHSLSWRALVCWKIVLKHYQWLFAFVPQYGLRREDQKRGIIFKLNNLNFKVHSIAIYCWVKEILTILAPMTFQN